MRKGQSDGSSGNRLLAGLPKASMDRLWAKGQVVTVSVEDILYHPGASITAVYFPFTCVISLITEMKNGATLYQASGVRCQARCLIPGT